MANTITKTTLLDGSRKLVVKFDITGDGSGEETVANLIDASTYSPAFINSRLTKIWASLTGFSAELIWDATTNVVAFNLSGGVIEDAEFGEFGGITNNAGTGITGDLLLATIGLGAGDKGTIILQLEKKGA